MKPIFMTVSLIACSLRVGSVRRVVLGWSGVGARCGRVVIRQIGC